MQPAVKKKGWSIQQLADAIGVSYQAVLKVRDGGGFSSKNNIKAAEVLGLDPVWLATGKEGGVRTFQTPLPVLDAETNEAPSAGYIRLPILAQAAAGAGAYPLDEVVQYVDVRESYIYQQLGVNPKDVCVLTARGGSMTGEIEDGDVMFVQPVQEFTRDGIYILTVGEWIRVKRLRLMVASQVIRIESNDGGPSEDAPCSEVGSTLFIQGRVLGWWSLKKG